MPPIDLRTALLELEDARNTEEDVRNMDEILFDLDYEAQPDDAHPYDCLIPV
jgi:hypothetical protein